jgi:hypothetical protein
VQAGNDRDAVTLLQFYSSTATRQARILLVRMDPMGLVVLVERDGESLHEDNAHFKAPVGRWFDLEIDRFVHDSGGYIGAVRPGVCRITSSRGADPTNTRYRLGALDQSGDWQGTVYFDELLLDEGRVYDDAGAHNGALSGGSLFFAKSGFAFLGPGEVEHLSVIEGGSGDCRVRLYDTDHPTRLPVGALRYDLKVPAASATAQSTSRRVPFKRGAFVQLSGTNPQAIVRLGKVASDREDG